MKIMSLHCNYKDERASSAAWSQKFANACENVDLTLTIADDSYVEIAVHKLICSTLAVSVRERTITNFASR